MTVSRTVRLALRLALTASACAVFCPVPGLRAQAYTPPPPPLDAPCKPTKKDPCTTPPPSTVPPAKGLAFPFPGDTSDAVTLDPNANPDDPANKPAPPAQPGPGQPGTKDGQGENGKFPFPGDASSSDSSSSSSSQGAGATPSASDTADDDDPPAPVPANRRHLPKVEDLDAREAKDVDVSGFYFSKGDFLAAYNRGKDAVLLMPDDPEAHFAVAQAAARLLKTAEAREEYQLALKLDLTDARAKVARAELQKLH